MADYMDENPSGGGRPFLTINERGKKLIETLAGYMCTDEEIANALGTTVDTLHNKNNEATFSECKSRGQGRGKVSLRRMQFHLAEKNANMAIWLGRNILGQKDRNFDDDEESRQARAEEMRQFARMSSPSKKDVQNLFADEVENGEEEESP